MLVLISYMLQDQYENQGYQDIKKIVDNKTRMSPITSF